MYMEKLGRFLSQDPIGFKAKDNNLYRYVRNSPPNHTDPSGMDIYLMATSGTSEGQHYDIFWYDPAAVQAVLYSGGGPEGISSSGGPFSFLYPEIGFAEARRAPKRVGSTGGFPFSWAGSKEYATFDDLRKEYKNYGIRTGLSPAQELTQLDKAYTSMVQIPFYHPFGPNSNTYAKQLLKNAGIPGVAAPPGAKGWDYIGAYAYGGNYFTEKGYVTDDYVQRTVNKYAPIGPAPIERIGIGIAVDFVWNLWR